MLVQYSMICYAVLWVKWYEIKILLGERVELFNLSEWLFLNVSFIRSIMCDSQEYGFSDKISY